jgi:hypothetical protein
VRHGAADRAGADDRDEGHAAEIIKQRHGDGLISEVLIDRVIRNLPSAINQHSDPIHQQFFDLCLSSV